MSKLVECVAVHLAVDIECVCMQLQFNRKKIVVFFFFLPFPPRLWCFCTCFFSLLFPGDKSEDLSVSSPSSGEAIGLLAVVATSVFCFRVWSLANGMISQSAGRCHTVV